MSESGVQVSAQSRALSQTLTPEAKLGMLVTIMDPDSLQQKD
jgi:hypothetical protein